MTPAQLAALRDSLPPFADVGLVPAQLQDYCRFYGLDFEARLPRVHHRIGSVTAGPYTLAVQCWLQPGASANLLLVHGYFDHAGLYGKLIEFGLLNNCNVLIFDLPGHGLSSGEPAVIGDFGDYGLATGAVLEAASPSPDLPLWVMAQSTGCAALVEYARRGPWPFAATVLLAPLLHPRGWKTGRLLHTLARPFKTGLKRKFVANSSDPQFLDFLKRDPLQSQRLSLAWVSALKRWLAGLQLADLGVGPALIVQGDADQTVEWRYNIRAYCELFPHSRIEMLPGAGHHLANESEAVRRTYYSLVGGYIHSAGITRQSSDILVTQDLPSNAGRDLP
ncbi:MAG: alpha/beta hydrolase [Pseudomonadales bacterium]|nr:alpha/beta hydrolase [Pseudomonadales bacterium]